MTNPDGGEPDVVEQGQGLNWSNWSGRQTASPCHILQPSTEAEMIAAVDRARIEGLPLRAVGATHSHSRVAATDGVVVETDGWQGLVEADPEAQTARLRAGTRVFQAGPLLFDHGLSVRNQGDIDQQSIAGAISTGTHGTGPGNQNFSASVEALTLVLATGEVVRCSIDEKPELFRVARHSLGGVGLVTEVELGVRDAYKLHETQWFEHPDEVFGRIDELVAATRHFEFFWQPDRDSCVCKTLAETDAEPDDLPDQKFERVGWSHDVISSVRDNLHTEMEYSVPAEVGPECFFEIRAMIQSDFPDLLWPIEYRTLASDDVWISTANGRETVTISAHEDVALDDRPLFEACEAIFKRYEGRPHWGKVHYRTGRELAALHADYQRWWDVRDAHDPDGVFLTSDLAALRPG